MSESGRCVPCADGRALLAAGLGVRLAWALAAAGAGALRPGAPGAAARWLGLAASAAVPVLAYRLAMRVRLSRGAALIAGALAALDPWAARAAARDPAAALWAALSAGFVLAAAFARESRLGRDRAAALALGAALLPAGALAAGAGTPGRGAFLLSLSLEPVLAALLGAAVSRSLRLS